MLFIQEHLANLRRNTSRAPHLQSTSKQVGCKSSMHSLNSLCTIEPLCGAYLG